MTNPKIQIDNDFAAGIDPMWHVAEIGTGTVTQGGHALQLAIRPDSNGYSNAQIADYPYPPRDFRWRPPLRMSVTAWASSAASNLVGTAGFGFWNHPFSPDTNRMRLPRAIWFFFGSPPNDMSLALDVPGYGFKAATLDAARPQALALIPAAVPLMLMMRSTTLYRSLWGGIQSVLGISEHALDGTLLTQRHTYALEWLRDGAVFSVDGQVVHTSPHAPRGSAGFVAWMDNQYAIATPQGKLRFGLIPVERDQSLFLERVTIESL